MIQILQGDCLKVLPTLESKSVQCIVTSPPYFGLRNYGVDGQLGLEATPREYIERLVAVFHEVWRVLKDDGVVWINLGDSYCSIGHKKSGSGYGTTGLSGGKAQEHHPLGRECDASSLGLKHKDLCMIPARVAIALCEDGWYLRSEIVWAKPNPMPESVTNRCTKSHEMIYMLAKNGVNPLVWKARDTGEWSYKPDLSEMISPTRSNTDSWNGSKFTKGKTFEAQLQGSYTQSEESRESDEAIPRWKGFDYYFDADAIREPCITTVEEAQSKWATRRNGIGKGQQEGVYHSHRDIKPFQNDPNPLVRNKRSVWTVASAPFSEAHFATFPPDLIKPCILASSRLGDTVLDPFAGSGTTGMVSLELGRKAILIELNPRYCEMAEDRCNVTTGML